MRPRPRALIGLTVPLASDTVAARTGILRPHEGEGFLDREELRLEVPQFELTSGFLGDRSKFVQAINLDAFIGEFFDGAQNHLRCCDPLSEHVFKLARVGSRFLSSPRHEPEWRPPPP